MKLQDIALLNAARAMATIVLLVANEVHAEELAATPYRPTVANPAELPVPGRLELETGWLRHTGGGPRRDALPYTAKFAFNQDWGVLLGGELWARERVDGDAATGRGDTAIVLKHRIGIDERRAFGIEAGVNLPTAGHDLGSGKPDWTLTGIYSVDFTADWRLDVNAGLSRAGAPEDGEGHASAAWAASVSHGIGHWTWAGELSGTHYSGTSDAQALVAASYAVTSACVVDIGFSVGKQGGERQNSLFFGATWLAGKLF